ncbi:tetratricopeptide repeat protein [Nostoc sp. XA013]|nr:tetratricopeptide repeat protein [Nostoc sp. XA013]
MGAVYSDLGEKQEALKHYNQALTIFRAVGHRAGEANTLNNIGISLLKNFRLHCYSLRAFFCKIIQPQLTNLSVRRRSPTQASHL